MVLALVFKSARGASRAPASISEQGTRELNNRCVATFESLASDWAKEAPAKPLA
jgi:hypothetical protein